MGWGGQSWGGSGYGSGGAVTPPVTSQTEQILAAIVSLLNAPGHPAALTVDRERQRAVSIEQLPQMSVYPTREAPERAGSSRTSKVTNRVLTVELLYRAAGDSTATDPLRAWAIKQIMSDPSLGGLALGTDEGETEWGTDEGTDGFFEAGRSLYLVRYVTRSNDLISKL